MSNLLFFALKSLGGDSVVDETVIEIISTKMGITSSCLYIENAILNSKKGLIESSSVKIEDEKAVEIVAWARR